MQCLVQWTLLQYRGLVPLPKFLTLKKEDQGKLLTTRKREAGTCTQETFVPNLLESALKGLELTPG